MAIDNERIAMIAAVKARTFLEQAKAELPDHDEQIDEARQLLWDLDFAGAKAIAIGLFEHCEAPPANLSHALMLIVATLGEPVEPILKYLQVRPPAKNEE